MPNITTVAPAPTLVRQVANGKLYRGGSGDDWFHIVHLWSPGSDDDYHAMGFAYGALLPDEMADMFARIVPWLAQMLEEALPWLPKELADLVVELGAPRVLDLLKDLIKKHIPARYYQEVRHDGFLFGALVEADCHSFLSSFSNCVVARY